MGPFEGMSRCVLLYRMLLWLNQFVSADKNNSEGLLAYYNQFVRALYSPIF